jgi:hypothetical protein
VLSLVLVLALALALVLAQLVRCRFYARRSELNDNFCQPC